MILIRALSLPSSLSLSLSLSLSFGNGMLGIYSLIACFVFDWVCFRVEKFCRGFVISLRCTRIERLLETIVDDDD